MRIDSYFLEYQATESLENLTPKVNQTPVMNKSTTCDSILVEEDCFLYSITLGVIPQNHAKSNCTRLLYSKPRVFWPSGRHTIGKDNAKLDLNYEFRFSDDTT